MLPSGVESSVARIVTFDGDLQEAAAGEAITLVLKDEIDISPVSYTHLDVYKRQQQRRGGEGKRLFAKAVASGAVGGQTIFRG